MKCLDHIQYKIHHNKTPLIVRGVTNASGAYFEVTGRHGKVKTTHSDRVYLVLEGSGNFTIGDETFSVEAMDMLIIPKNTPYDYKTSNGTMKLFLVHTPAYNADAEVKLE